MKLVLKDKATRSRWIDFADGLSFEIHYPTQSEREAWLTQFRINSEKPDWTGARRWAASNWVKNFKGVELSDGSPAENDPQTRFRILEEPAIWDWLIARIMAHAEWLEEGNAGSGSD